MKKIYSEICSQYFLAHKRLAKLKIRLRELEGQRAISADPFLSAPTHRILGLAPLRAQNS